jgi:hypothetical protein
MAFCRQCGSPVEGAFCTKCGAKMDAPGTPGAPPPQPPPPPAAPPQAPPQQAAPAPPPYIPPPSSSAPPPQKKGRWIFWTLGGCLLVIIIGVIIVFSTCTYFAHKAGLDPDLLQKKPELAMVKMLVSANPDLELVSIDEDRGIIRVREKKTGKELTVDLENAKKGKIVFSDENNKKVEIQTQGEGANAGMEIKSDEGSVKIGANAASQLPNWLPPYPGAEAAGGMMLNAEKGNGGSCTFKSKDSIEAVSAYYENALKGAGFEVKKVPMQIQGQGSMIMLAASDDKTQRKASVTAAHTPDGTVISLTYEGK